jgi:hypothetical protein
MAISGKSDSYLIVENAVQIPLQRVSPAATSGPRPGVVSSLDSTQYISANSRLEGTLEIKQGRMVHLGYGKYWRSDEIVGLCPIEENRGPGRRTEVYVATREDSLVVSRSEQSILSDMASLPDNEFEAEEARSLLSEFLEDLHDVNPVLRRMLENEVRVDLDMWERRIKGLLLRGAAVKEAENQEDLFSSSS